MGTLDTQRALGRSFGEHISPYCYCVGSANFLNCSLMVFGARLSSRIFSISALMVLWVTCTGLVTPCFCAKRLSCCQAVLQAIVVGLGAIRLIAFQHEVHTAVSQLPHLLL
jgi:hypothetical protein